MSRTFFSLVISLLVLTGCQSSYRLWKEGLVSESEFLEEIPFTVQQDLIFVTPVIRGKTYRFILDTGAPNVITEEVATELNLGRTRYGSVSDSQGEQQDLEGVVLPPVTLGNLTFTDTRALVADMRSVSIFDCLDVDGLLGANLMAKTCWQIDYAARTIRMANSCAAFQLDDPTVIRFTTKSTFTPVIKSLQIGEQKVKNITLDYGSGNGITLPQTLFSENELASATVVSVGASGTGLYGTRTGQVKYIPSVVPKLSTDSLHLRIRESGSRLLGMDILKQFRATIDWRRNRLLLERQKPGWPQWVAFGLGISELESDLVINAITTPSPAQKAGIRVGQKVLRINGRPVDARDYCWISKEIGQLESMAIALETADGEIEVKLQKMAIYPLNQIP